PGTIFSLRPDLSFRQFSVDEVNAALAAGEPPPGVEPWLSAVTGPLDETPLTLSTSLIPPGEYALYLLVAPAGSLEAFYLWTTQFVVPAPAAPPPGVTLSWDPPITNADGTPLNDLAGFKVYRGTSSRRYSTSVDVGNVRSYTLQNLSPGTHYFSVTAYDASRNESTFSNEVSKTVR
ncbi:MAG TPA: fibronectin type III domain-containing protein, partial [Dissulfurispiraceae bacterium]|nr:fibronectin type III domain-containing protein [Dissulfurispiraceae bacterium]